MDSRFRGNDRRGAGIAVKEAGMTEEEGDRAGSPLQIDIPQRVAFDGLWLSSESV